MKETIKYTIPKVLFSLVTFFIVMYGVIGISYTWDYSKGIWNIAQVYMWFHVCAECFVIPCAFSLLTDKKALKKARKNYQKTHPTPISEVIGIFTHIIEIATLAYFGHFFYAAIWILSFILCFFVSLILKNK
jgi:hypothetical protein